MKLSRSILGLGALLLVLAGVGAGTGLAQDAMKVVQDRQAVMKEQGKALGAVKAYLDGKGDLAQAQTGASELSQTVRKIPALFPAGTGMEQFPGKSGAKPAIWTDQAKFQEAAQNAQAKIDALAAAVKGGEKAAIEAAFNDLGKNGCGGCHTTFREKL
jgi:cytochrome c556